MVECGAEHILILDSLGRVYSYGRNTFGQCGLNHTNYVTEFTVRIYNLLLNICFRKSMG